MVETSTPLPTTDTAATTADKTVGEIVGATETIVETEIIAAEPVMNTPVLKQIWEGILNWIFGLLKTGLGTLTGYIVIDIQKYADLRTAAQALAQLKAAQTSGDANAIATANTNADAALAPVLHFIGTS